MTESILWCIKLKLCFTLWAKIEPKRKYEWLRARAPNVSSRSAEKLYFHNRQRIKSSKIVLETSYKSQYSYFYILYLFLKLTGPDPTWTDQVEWNIAQLLNATHLLCRNNRKIQKCKKKIHIWKNVQV